MAFEYKKEYEEFYMTKNKPDIVKIPKINYSLPVKACARHRIFNNNYIFKIIGCTT